MRIKVLSFWAKALFFLKAQLLSQGGALSFTVINVISKGLGGRKVRLVTITFDAAYVNGTGYTVTPSDVNLKTNIKSVTAINLNGYQVAASISGNNAVLRAWKGNTEASTNEAGLDTLTGLAVVIGY